MAWPDGETVALDEDLVGLTLMACAGGVPVTVVLTAHAAEQVIATTCPACLTVIDIPTAPWLAEARS